MSCCPKYQKSNPKIEKKINKKWFDLKIYLVKGFKYYHSEKVLNISNFKQKYFQEKVGT